MNNEPQDSTKNVIPDVKPNMNSFSSKQSDNKPYNLIINQNSTYNQDNSINIMVEGSLAYFQNYNTYQTNESESKTNQRYPQFPEEQPINTKPKEINDDEKKIINDDKLEEAAITPKRKKKKKASHKNLKIKKEEEIDSPNLTNKIDYRYIKKRPIKDIIKPYTNDIITTDMENQFFWFATYDKLMKTKYLLKIFSYYNNRPFDSQHNINYKIKEKTLVIKDFEIYFYENSNRPFIRYAKGGTIYTKLYLLTLKQINQIFSYLNRIEYKIDYDRLNYLQRKGTFEIINDNSNNVALPYCLIYCLGKYMNINIFALTNNIDYNIYSDENSFQKNQRISAYTVINNNNNRYNYFLSNEKKNNKIDDININRNNFKLPNAKKIAKLIKIINLNYPDFSIDEIINYLIPDNKYLNSITKISEIKNIFFFKKSNQNKIILSSMVRDTIKGISIQTPKSLISSFCPAESILENNSFKNSDLFQPPSKKYVIPIKDDYKFQTISANDKDNGKNNPFIIYVCDNIQKINFTNDNQTNQLNNNTINNCQIQPNLYSQQNNKSIVLTQKNIPNNNNNNYIQTDINEKQKTCSRINQKINNNIIPINKIDNNNNDQNHNKKGNLNSDKMNNRKMNEKIKIKYNNNVLTSGNKNKRQIKRISTDIHTMKSKVKYHDISSLKNKQTKPRESYNISKTNFKLGNLNNSSGQYELSRKSDIYLIRKQKTKNVNKIKLINRINMNKKNNPFFDKNKTNS